MKNIRQTWSEAQLKQLKVEFSNTALLPNYFEKKYNRNWTAIMAKANRLGWYRGKASTYRCITYYLDKAKVKALYRKGLSCRAIAKIMGCSFPIISAALKEMAVRVKSKIETLKK